MNISITNAKESYHIFLDNIYLDYCIEADDILDYAIVYDANETRWAGTIFRKPYDILLYRKVYGNISIIKAT